MVRGFYNRATWLAQFKWESQTPDAPHQTTVRANYRRDQSGKQEAKIIKIIKKKTQKYVNAIATYGRIIQSFPAFVRFGARVTSRHNIVHTTHSVLDEICARVSATSSDYESRHSLERR